MQQNGHLGGKKFLIGNLASLAPEFAQGHTHKVVSAKAMVQAGMYRARVHQLRHGHLMDAPQPLIPGMADYLHHQRMLQADKSVNGVVYYFSFEGHAAAKVSGFFPVFMSDHLSLWSGMKFKGHNPLSGLPFLHKELLTFLSFLKSY
jgi:hypothetical protein